MSERDKKAYWALKADPVKYAAYLERKRKARLSRQTNRGYETERKQNWRAEHPTDAQRIRKANHAVETELKAGRMIRPEACEKCGAKGPVEGHHESYAPDQWLVVIWLCQMCHARRHHPRAA